MLVVALDGGLSVRYDNFLKTSASLVSKPWMRKVRMRRGHLLDEKRTILAYLETWLSSYFFRNKTFLFIKIKIWKSFMKHQKITAYSDNVYLLGLKIVLMSWNLWGFPTHSSPNSLQISILSLVSCRLFCENAYS